MTENAEQTPHTLEWKEVARELEVEIEKGLGDKESASRLRKYGQNRLEEKKKRGAFSILIDQFKSVVMLLLAVAGAVAFGFGKLPEGIAIIAVLIVNTLIGFISEYKARRSMRALREMGQQQARVLRGGEEYQIPAEQIVPGDILLLEGGDVIPADMRLVEVNALRVNEASLTGESVPVRKKDQVLSEDTPLAERTNVLFKGTTITEGSAKGIVTATGRNTQLGRISELAEKAEKEETPLEARLNELGGRLAYISLATVAILAVVGLLRGKPPLVMIETAIALGVAAIPEGLPVVATIALARGMWLMARRQALINRLAAVETLGSTQVIFTDKTGTLTESEMQVRKILTSVQSHSFKEGSLPSDTEDSVFRDTLRAGILCSNATLRDEDQDKEPETVLGDPTEVAILRLGMRLDILREDLLEDYPEEKEHSFDPDQMMMATVHRQEDLYLLVVKGAPEKVLQVCTRIRTEDGEEELTDEGREGWLKKAEEMASEGLRLIAAAEKETERVDDTPYEGLCFLGLLGLIDPPREGIRETIQACKEAGIRVVMITGDRPGTALAIAEQVGLPVEKQDGVMTGQELETGFQDQSHDHEKIMNCRVFARVTPEQKLNLLELYQNKGYKVAMTGDGVNDAPALRTADIGVAMGQRGTDAARQAADMILRDDAFSSIVAAVEQGRIIFRNIRKSVMFMLCTNVAEIIAVAGASFAGLPLPLNALQILYLNVITDVFPALALSVGKGGAGIMKEKPRSEGILTRSNWQEIAIWGFIIAACVLGGLLIGLHWLDLSKEAAVTVSFLTLAFAKLTFTFNLRSKGSGFFKNDITVNPWVWGAIALCLVLLFAAVYLPGLADILKNVAPGPAGWLTIIVLAFVPWTLGQIRLGFSQKGESESGS